MAFYRGYDVNTITNPAPHEIPCRFTIPANTNMSTTPTLIAQGLNHNTAIDVIWIYANVAPAGATKFRIAICAQNGTSDTPGTQLLANLAVGDITVSGTPDNPDNVPLGTNIGLPIGKILAKAPEVLPGGFDLFFYGDAALTNTVTFHIYTEYHQSALVYIDSTFRTSPVEVLTAAS